MGTTLVLSVTTSTSTMKCLIILTVAALASCDADADALYSTYGAALRYPYAYAARGYAAPIAAVRAAPIAPIAAVRAAPIAAPAVGTIAAPVAAVRAAPIAAPAVRTIAAPVAAVRSAVPSVTSSQYHSQDEDKNYSFGYSNINSARQESGNAYTGVVGSYSDGVRTYNYVADGLGFRHI